MENVKLEYRYDVINYLIQKYGYDQYVELGHNSGQCFKKVQCKNKESVDIDDSLESPTFLMSTDEYFEKHAKPTSIFFVDALHHSDQVYKDILNSLANLKEGGTIICHDMNPPTELIQRVPRESIQWTGDCWKSFVKLRTERDDLEMFVIDCDWGLGLIRRSKEPQPLLDLKGLEINYDNFDANRTEWLNLISPEEALKRL